MKNKNLPSNKLQRDNFFSPFESIDRAFDDLLSFPTSASSLIKSPAVDMKETEKDIIVSVDLPGVDKKDIKLDLTEDSIAISCERSESKEENGKGGYHIKEQRYGKFYRSFSLPAPIKTKDSKASYKNGVLTITLPKQKPSTVHRINID